MGRRLAVGIFPASQHTARARLWHALEAAYPVRFEGRGHDGGARGLDGILAFGAGADGGDSPAAGAASLTMHREEAVRVGPPRALALAESLVLARPLRGARLSDGSEAALAAVSPEEVVLATLDGAPAWVARSGEAGGPRERLAWASAPSHQRVACAPAELEPGEALRERLRPGRCLALLALAHFLAELTARPRAPAPPLRAAFVIDDPNLRRPRYGHLDYAELLRHAREHGYHLAVAHVPLDTRLAHPRATAVFRAGARHLSLCVHGNDHDGPELGRALSRAEALAVVAQALRRCAAFQRRTGVPVERVMVPPHERLSESVARALRVCGFQAVCTTRPYPWLADSLDRPWLARPVGAGPLVAWGAVDRVAGGLPVLLRAEFDHPREDLALRAFLGQPLILYGHHDLLADGPDALAQATAAINRLGDVRWNSLGTIAPACPPLDAPSLEAIPRPPRRRSALLRRLASEGRDRLTPMRGPTAARGARPRSWSGRR